MKTIAIIPARTTSKRLPEKNFRLFWGRPMLDWVIDEAYKSEIFDKVIVSVDKEYNIYEGELFIRRNPTYEQTVDDVVTEVLFEYSATEYCVIYPTAYAVTAEHLLKGYGKYSFGMINGDYKLDNGGFYYKDAKEGYEMPMVDINTLEDFIQAKLHALTLTDERFK